MQWPADTVERRSVASLVPYARNARTHSLEQIDQIAASIREWGWTVPVLVDEQGGIIAGEMTGRHVYAIELSPAYVDVAVKRWQDFTGKQATLEGDGRTFDEVNDVRYKSDGASKNSAASYDVAIKAMREAHEKESA